MARLWIVGFRVMDFGWRVMDLVIRGYRVLGFGFRVNRVPGFGFRVYRVTSVSLVFWFLWFSCSSGLCVP